MIANRPDFKLMIAAAVIMLAFTELSCFFFFQTFQQRFTFYHPEDLLFKETNLEKAKKVYDRDLGWLRRFPTPYGERLRAKDFGRGLLATFGDSYTHGDQVFHYHTFQTFLAKKLKADVYNFGVGGYGTDQALLRFRKEYPKVRTPIVALGLITENINRIVNVYRRFYYQETELSLPKPRFKLEQGHLALLPNPIQSFTELSKLLDPEFISNMGQNDWWYNRQQHPQLRFPFSAILFNKRLWLEAYYGRAGYRINDVNARPWEELWTETEPRKLMFAIFDTFVREARNFGAIPIILLLPIEEEVLERITGQKPAAVRTIMRYCQQKKYYCFNGIQAIAKSVSSEDEVNDLFRGHLNAAGNKMIADHLHLFLLRKNIIKAEKVDNKKKYFVVK